MFLLISVHFQPKPAEKEQIKHRTTEWVNKLVCIRSPRLILAAEITVSSKERQGGKEREKQSMMYFASDYYLFLLITEHYQYTELCLKQRHSPKEIYHLRQSTKRCDFMLWL